MKRWLAGYLMIIAAGVSLLIAAALPWAQVGEPALLFSAFQLHLYEPLIVVVATGVFLIAFGATRTMWAALAGLVGAFAAGMTIVMIHGAIYVGLHVAAPSLTLGETVHVTGYGVAVMFAAGMLAGVGGLITAVQAAPKVTF